MCAHLCVYYALHIYKHGALIALKRPTLLLSYLFAATTAAFKQFATLAIDFYNVH